MTETELKIIDTFKRSIPFLSEVEKQSLLAFGEGLAFFTHPPKKKDEQTQKSAHDVKPEVVKEIEE